MNPNAKSFVPHTSSVEAELTNYHQEGLKSNLRPSALPFVLPAATSSAAANKSLRASAPEFRPAFLTNSVGSMSSLTTESPVVSPNPHVSEHKAFVPIQSEPPISLPSSQAQPIATVALQPQQAATTSHRHHYTLQALLALRCHASHPQPSVVSSDVYVPQPVFASNIAVAPPSAPSKPNALRAHKEGMAFLERRVISTLNKLTPEKYDTLIRELLKEMGVELRVTHEGMEAMLQRIIPRIVDKAIMESKFCDMYAQLCSDLFKEIRNLDNGAIIYTEVIDDKSEMTFDSSQRFQIHLLNKLQSEFQVQVIENSEDEGPRKRKLATAQFVAEIFFRGLLPPGVLHKVLSRLLNVKAPKLIDVECACKIFPIIGKKLEEEGNIMNQYFSAIKAIRESAAVSTQTRIKVLLDNLNDLRANKWIPKHSNKATKLSECNNEPNTESREVSQQHHSSSHSKEQPKNLAERLRGILDGKHQVPTSHSSNSRATPNSKTPNRSSPNTPQRGSPVSKELPSTTIYITQIDNMITEGQLMEFLTAFGDVHKVRLCGNTQQPTQYGFFEFATAEGAQRCLLADRVVLGRFNIHCSQSRNAVHDTLPHDVVMGPRGPTRACIFGQDFPTRTLAESVTLQPPPVKKSGTRTPTMTSSASANSLCDHTPGVLDEEAGSSSNEDSRNGSLNQRIVSDEELVNLETQVHQNNIVINFPALVSEYLTAFNSDEDRDAAMSQQLGQITEPTAFIKDSITYVTQKSKLVAERNALAFMIKFIHPALKTIVMDAIQNTVEDAVMEEQRVDCPLVWANYAHFFQSCKQANSLNNSDLEHILQPVRTSEEEWAHAATHLNVFLS